MDSLVDEPIDRDFFRFQTRPWCQVFTFSPLRSDVAGRGSGSPRPSWTSGPWWNCRAWLTYSWTSRHRESPHMPTLGRVSGRPRAESPRWRLAQLRVEQKKFGNLGVGLRAAYDVQGTRVGHVMVPVALRHRSCDACGCMIMRSALRLALCLQLLWFSGRARPLPQTVDDLGSGQSSETIGTDV